MTENYMKKIEVMYERVLNTENITSEEKKLLEEKFEDITEEEFFEFIKEDNTDILSESINEQDVKSIFKETAFSVENIEKIEKYINSVNQEESSNINPNDIPSKEEVLQILKDMKNFNMFELYTFLRKKDKSDDANKGNSNKVNVREKIKKLMKKRYEENKNQTKKELIYTTLEEYFYKDSINNFAKATGIDINDIKKCLKQNSKHYCYGDRALEKICKELGIS